MNRILLKYISKLFFKKWIIGICRDNIKDIIRSKIFNPDINWLSLNSPDHFCSDPFLLKTREGILNIFYEDFAFDDYGKISLMTIDDNFKLVNQKMLLDTKSHLSYPFVFKENNKIYVFPESALSGRLSCYEYDPVNQSLNFLQDILNLPLLDSTILKHNNKYWLFGTIIGKDSNSKLYIYFSNNLLGPYTPHPDNPVKNSLNGSRPAGNFIEVDGVIYRPSQNCENYYGESISINKVDILNEFSFAEEPHMLICVNRNNLCNDHILTMHTINVIDDIIAVDGTTWTFSPKKQWKYFLRERTYSQHLKESQKKNHKIIPISSD